MVTFFVLIVGCASDGAVGTEADEHADSGTETGDSDDANTSDLVVEVIGETTLRLRWSYSHDPGAFVIQRLGSNGEHGLVAEVSGSVRDAVTDFLPCEDDLRFQVIAREDGRDAVVGRSAPVDVCDMVRIEDGPTWVGCDPAVDSMCYPDEMPIHRVHLDSYWMDRTEVSFEAYNECMEAGACATPAIEPADLDLNWDTPVIGVNWFMADAYCEWRGKRLPTEAEWEKAGRGNGSGVYPWGDEWDPTLANWDDQGRDDGYALPAPVTAFADTPSPYDIQNLTGNVWEWVADYYGADYYSVSPKSNPGGPETGSMRIAKGGAWRHDFYETKLRLSHRNAEAPEGVSDHVGFRCARN
ncbi:MAG: SUMF1/EgtB/PvdO family nonheme iron enzyme [Deltaproteobacteria bacterium]|nr:SUMF1/EgtB/PvdO family nonheme iron enzyme [Deltaproteobacteria bacterium]